MATEQYETLHRDPEVAPLTPIDVEETDGAEGSATRLRWKPAAGIASATTLLAVLLVASWQHFSQPTLADADTRLMESAEIGFDSSDAGPVSECEASDWSGMTTVSVEAKRLVAQALNLMAAKRQGCMGQLGQIDTPPEDWLKGVDHTHSVHIDEKCLASTKAKAYRLHFHVIAAKETTFLVEMHRDLSEDVFTWVTSEPAPCDIRIGTAAGPQNMNLKSKRVTDMAKFAIGMLNNKAKSCLPGGATQISFTTVKEAISQVTNAFTVRMIIEAGLTGGSETETTFETTVTQRCADSMTHGKCVNQLAAPGGDVCKIFLEPVSGRRLERQQATGALPEDLSEILDARLRHIDTLSSDTARRLSTPRPPLMERYIKTGSVPSSFDPRGEQCYKQITVYNQGSCGSCYANAWAQMMGIRICKQQKGRRLERVQNESVVELPNQDVERNGTTATARMLSSCQDSNWQLDRQHTCAWFAKNDPGCTKYKDYGQQSNCQKTCGTCPSPTTPTSSSNPWYGAWYQYMPSVTDVATCSVDQSGAMAGCDGGNSYEVWNNNIAKLTREINIMGDKCMPYTMKCEESDGIVNPLAGGACSKYNGYELWHKPCSCIPSSQRPRSWTCPRSTKRGCGFQAPPAAFIVKSVAQGLSVAEANNNMLRHINEFGPIYVAFSTTTAFMDWDWRRHPVYTGGGRASGGHAVTIVGWGTYGSTKYWIIRNSWGSTWAEGGYCKFQRGINLDNIEGRSVAVSMPTVNFKDWSPPSCTLSKWTYSYRYYSTSLSSMTLDLQVQCDKSAKLKIFTSNLLAHRDDINNGVRGSYHDVNAHAGVNDVKGINAICRGFGLKTGDMWVQIQADDGKGNTADSSHFVTLKAVPRMTSIHSSARSQCR